MWNHSGNHRRAQAVQGFRILPLAALALLMAFALACAGEADPVPTDPPQVTVTAGPATSTSSAQPTGTPVAPSGEGGPSGELTVAVSSVGTATSGYVRDCAQCEFLTAGSVQDVLHITAYGDGGDLTEIPSLASSWELAPDGSYTDFTLREDVEFHKGWGNMTAEDVAWTFNTANPAITPDSIHATGSEIATAMDQPVEVIDTYTARFHWKGFSTPTYPKTTTQYREGVGIFSKKAFDEKGADWVRDNVIGTGPFEMDEWTQHNGMFVNAVANHWRQTPMFARVAFLEVPEAATRRAMLESGQAQIAEIDSKDWAALLDAGFAKSTEGATIDQGIIMGGNYWSRVHPISGATLDRPQREMNANLPWVGDPEDPERNERARKVRWALSLTIDREGINQALYGGAARVSYMGGVNDLDPVFQSNIDKYKIPYDPDLARQYLQEAGYEDGFTVDFYVDGQEGSVSYELTQALAAGWMADLNVDMRLDQTPYATHRPNFVNRSDRWLSFRTGGAFAPSTWQEEWYIGAGSSAEDGSPAGGFNSGIEVDIADQTIARKLATTDLEEVKAATIDYLNFVNEQQLWPGTIEYTEGVMYDPEAIAEWTMFPMASGNLPARQLEYAVPGNG